MSTQLESTVIDPTNTTDLLERLLFAYACALTGFTRYPTYRDREQARMLITRDPAWDRVGMPSRAAVSALLKENGLAMPAPLAD